MGHAVTVSMGQDFGYCSKGTKIISIKYSSDIHTSVYIRSDKLQSYQLVFGSQRGKM